MSDTLDPLIRDLVEWVAKAPRSYSDVLDAWRTSCPRLTVWEDAVDRGYLARKPMPGSGTMVVTTELGRKFLAERSVGLNGSAAVKTSSQQR